MTTRTSAVRRPSGTCLCLLVLAVAGALLGAMASSARAQGNLSTFGFGYPPGQLSARAQSAGGAIGEIDPLSALNPAALMNWAGSSVYFQIEPEFRRVNSPAGTDRTTTARFPLVAGGLALGQRWVLGEGSLKIVSSNAEQEEAQEELEVNYAGEALDIGFNVNYLLDVLNNVAGAEIECAFGDSSSSALISYASEKEFKYVVMPMRI
jgi:DNA polymerase III beta subunit, C-terminal domain